MTDTILNRIVDFAEKLETAEDIEQELSEWNNVHWYGAQLLALLNDYCSSPSMPPPPLLLPVPEPEQLCVHSTNDSSSAPLLANAEQSKKQAPPHCSNCGEVSPYTARPTENNKSKCLVHPEHPTNNESSPQCDTPAANTTLALSASVHSRPPGSLSDDE
ncbi:uncharacterized protein PHACADRAFT_33508 [Phanerochaete carnosa HHB-10118-sp]|uniref:Uncharacterized protein n=1 Tax=Phanerochaete carnosa (strain HHB-10118-sp) TaxID=650164 RepID=K5VRT9_PHACS|nr:uncharacterized protein PHACADRAFT_33508 [Phanerochaete carnosa HHB-10118-sp]EKM49480.1 hypothetical protein PHACADRAFT_33508 [Phanerochaete carnosa HHB-10118-sp]